MKKRKKKHTSATKIFQGLEKRFSKNGPKIQARVGTLISNKIDFQPKVINRDGKITSYSSKEKSNMMCQFWTSVYQIQGTHIHERNINEAQIIHWIAYNNSRGRQNTTLTNGLVIKTETQQRNNETKRCYEPNGSANIYSEPFTQQQKNIPPQKCMGPSPKLTKIRHKASILFKTEQLSAVHRTKWFPNEIWEILY